MNPTDGLEPGRIVYYVFSEQTASEVNRRRTDGESIAARIAAHQWPIGAQAHVGPVVRAGDILPAMVVRVLAGSTVNLKVMLDGSDDYWAQEVAFDAAKSQESWHWLFEGQATRYQPDRVEKAG